MFMKFSTTLFVAVGTLAAFGCGDGVGKVRPEPTKFNGTVLGSDGKPVGNVSLQFVPQFDGGAQAAAKVGPDGKFAVELNPGKFSYFFEPMRGKEAFHAKTIPLKYQAAEKEHVVDVIAGQDIAIKLN